MTAKSAVERLATHIWPEATELGMHGATGIALTVTASAGRSAFSPR